MRLWAQCIGFLALILAGQASAEIKLESYEYGLFGKPRSIVFEEGDRVLLSSGQDELTEQTHIIPAKVGAKFGIRFKVSGLKNTTAEEKNLVHFLYLTPGLVDNRGTHYDKYEVIEELSEDSEDHLMAFRFTDAYEAKPGEWIFYIFIDNRKLLEQRFIVQ